VSRPLAEYSAEKRESSVRAESVIRERGVRIIHKTAMHEKLAFLDDDMLWCGSSGLLEIPPHGAVMHPMLQRRTRVQSAAWSLQVLRPAGFFSVSVMVRHQNSQGRRRARLSQSRNLRLNDSMKILPRDWSFASKLRVQSHSQQAHGSVPFQSRQLRRACPSLMVSNSKYCSQYGRSSARGVGQKQTSTHWAVPLLSRRARSISQRYSSPATEPRPRDRSRIAHSRSFPRPGFTRALTRYRIRAPVKIYGSTLDKAPDRTC